MEITSITSQRNPERVNVFIDNEFAFGIFYTTKEDMKLEKGMEINEEFILKIKDRDQLHNAKSKAYNYLSFRQRTTKELRTYLLEKEFSISTAEQVINLLTEAGYIDDFEFAKIYIRDKSTYKNFGPYRLKNELIQKGISKEFIEIAIKEEYHEELQELIDLVKSKYSSIIHENSQKRYRRIGGFLQRRGHSFETIKKVLDSIDREEE